MEQGFARATDETAPSRASEEYCDDSEHYKEEDDEVEQEEENIDGETKALTPTTSYRKKTKKNRPST